MRLVPAAGEAMRTAALMYRLGYWGVVDDLLYSIAASGRCYAFRSELARSGTVREVCLDLPISDSSSADLGSLFQLTVNRIHDTCWLDHGQIEQGVPNQLYRVLHGDVLSYFVAFSYAFK